MNCKFCNNFIPDDAKICSICGKNVEEEALVKAEPETVAIAETAGTVEEKKADKVYKKKSLKFPSVLLILAIAAFVCLYAFGITQDGCAMAKRAMDERNATANNGVSVSDTQDNSGEYKPGGVENQSNKTEDELLSGIETDSIVTAVGANGAAALLGVAGAALLGKRVSNNRKFKKQEKTSAK